MDPDAKLDLSLDALAAGFPALTPSSGTVLAEAASVCLESQGHPLECILQVTGFLSADCRLMRLQVTNQMRACFGDPDEATEFGACGVAILLMREVIGMTVVERSWRGTGFDYWFGSGDSWPFFRAARVEVSGVRSGTASDVARRVRRKVAQVMDSGVDGPDTPTYVVVIEFARRLAHVEKP